MYIPVRRDIDEIHGNFVSISRLTGECAAQKLACVVNAYFRHA